MRLTKLGISDLKVSRIALGRDQFGTRVDQTTAGKIISAALDRGINFIDTAHIYGEEQSETLIGKVIGPKRKNLAR